MGKFLVIRRLENKENSMKNMMLVLVASLFFVTISTSEACQGENQTALNLLLDVTGDSFYYQKDDVCDRLEKSDAASYKKLNVEEVLAIHAYTENDYYKGINKVLRSRSVSKAERERYTPIINLMKSGLKKLPVYKGNVIRWVSWSETTLKRLKVGSTKVFKAFTSSSKKPNFTWSGNTKLQIKAYKAHFIGMISQYPTEEEVLFMPNSKFKVLAIDLALCSGCKSTVELEQVE